MALRKSQLHASLWQSCDQLRGGMDASQYKDYVLTLLLMKYVSDKYSGANDEFSEIKVPSGGGFADMVALKGSKEIGDGINVVIRKLADANDFLLKGVIDQADFNDESRLGRGREMTDRLTKLVGIFEPLDFRANRAQGDDLMGDAYEYLMRHVATQSGKSKGQFYTPAEVSRIMAQVVGIGPDTGLDFAVYDPTCGSGSLLIKAADEAPDGLTIYGQAMDVATWTMACMNMILHGNVDAEIKRDNALAAPRFTDGPGRLKLLQLRRRQIPRSLPRRGRTASIQTTTSAAASSTGSRPRRTATTPSSSISSLRSRARARARSFFRTGYSSAATERPASAAISSCAD